MPTRRRSRTHRVAGGKKCSKSKSKSKTTRRRRRSKSKSKA